MLARLATTVVLLTALVAPSRAQEEPKELPPDVVRAVREGMVETLESKFNGGRTADEIHLIAQACSNRARRARQAVARQRALDQADRRYQQWINTLEKTARSDASAKATVNLAGARVEYAGMLMGLRAAGVLDEIEISAGQRGDRDQLRTALTAALEQYAAGGEVVNRLYDELDTREDEFLAAGVYSTIIQLKLDVTYNAGWAYYYLGMIEDKDERQRGEALRVAERCFQTLLDSGQSGQMLYQCYLGLAMAQREMKRFDDAERSFASAMQEGVEAVVAAQARCELARCHVAAKKFTEARTVLAPLISQDESQVSGEERALRFYLNLARLLDANSYLAEAEAIRAQATGSTAKTAILRQAERTRQIGLARFNQLAVQGGPWPAVVQLYIASSIDILAKPEDLSPVELLYSARQLVDAQRYKDAVARLNEALARPQFQVEPAERLPDDTDLAGQLLMELGKCYYRLDEPAQAADAFDRLAREFRGHELAEQAATFAYQLRVEIARKSKQPADHAKLADTLLNLLQSFPEHPQRDEAAWLLPVTLQAAQRYAEAADEFAKIAADSPHHDEARLRELLCRRLALEARRGELTAEKYAQEGQTVADALRGYADETAKRAAELTPTEAKDLVTFSAEARVNAAELLASEGLERYQPALDLVSEFEQQHPDSDLIGRVLAVRIRAYRGLRQFEQATETLARYLEAVPSERAGAVLSSLAGGMQQEVERMQQDGRSEAAAKLAGESVETFVQLEQWLEKHSQYAAQVPTVVFGRAQMLYAAGRLDEARQAVAGLLERNAQNGNYQRLLALILTKQLTGDATADQITSAKDAWGELLKDPSLRKRAPERFWEARYHWLALCLREGAAEEVDKSIKELQVWYPDLGGAPWADQLRELRREARTKLGLPAEEAPEAGADGTAPKP
ncbi:MAG: hypothetical protein PVJ57_17920 [Phycisphaerae bacterium]|jgi:tetratricopeptide (TPR) repeat protein